MRHQGLTARRLRLLLLLLLPALLSAAACDTKAPDRRGPAAPPAGFAGIAPALERGEAPKTTSVLVMRSGSLVYEAYFNGAGAETLHDARSTGKSITALAIGIAIGRGVLPGVDAKVFPYLADLQPFAGAGSLKDAITVEDLLTMSSALDCDDDDPRNPGNEENMYPQPAWARWAVDLPTRADYRRDASGRGPWHYCTAGTFLLGQLLQRAVKQPVDDFIARSLFTPLGITRWQFNRSPTGEVMTGGQLRLRSRDFAAIGWLVRSGGRHGGTQIVPKPFLDAALTVHRNAFPGQDYGYQFWHRTYRTRCGDHAAWFMSGNGGNAVVILDRLDAVIVVTRTNYNAGRAMHDQTKALIERYILPELACPPGR